MGNVVIVLKMARAAVSDSDTAGRKRTTSFPISSAEKQPRSMAGFSITSPLEKAEGFPRRVETETCRIATFWVSL